MRIILYTGYQNPHWNPSLLDTTGLGGTEQCVLNLAKQLAIEHEVYVVGDVIEGEFGGVLYITTSNAIAKLGTSFVDCIIGVSYVNYLIELQDLNFTHSIFWVHNTDFYPWHRGETLPNAGRDLLNHTKMTGIVCLTDWHKNKFIEQFPEVEHKIKVIGNGVDVDNFVEVSDKLSNSFIYTSHAERGLSKVLKDWSDIRESKPNAELHIATPEYGLEYFNQNFLDEVGSLDSVFFHGTLPLNKLYDLMSKCEYWYYPTDYEETFCITALEMLGHRVSPVASECAALKETLGGFNLLTLENLESNIDWMTTSQYIKNCDWSRKKMLWTAYIYNMSTQVLNDPTDASDEIDMLSELESSVQSNNNENILNVDCLYIISLEHNSENLAKWKESIRSNIPWYTGPIVGKKAVNGTDVTNKWLTENNYELYDWQLPESDNSWWNRPLDPGAIGCAISHHQIWKHAHKNNFKNIIILEDDFEFNAEVSKEQLLEVPDDFDLFYLGRNSLPEWGSEVPVGNGRVVKPAPSYNTHAYMLSAKGVKSLLDQQFNKYIMPLDEFFICCYSAHPRQDLRFVYSDLIAYGVSGDDLIFQTRSSSEGGPRTVLPDRKHPDLYSYWEDPDRWKERFLTYAVRTKEWELIIDEPFDNCFSMPLFTQEFCEMIREEAEYSNAWTTDRHENYPTTDMLLGAIGMDRIYYEVLKEFIFPACIHLYSLSGSLGWDKMTTEDFLAKYVPTAQGHLSLHHDASDITALVTLSNFDEYEGGGTYFSHQKKLIKEKQGYVSIHPGNITHRHGARATTHGRRYIIVSFMSKGASH